MKLGVQENKQPALKEGKMSDSEPDANEAEED